MSWFSNTNVLPEFNMSLTGSRPEVISESDLSSGRSDSNSSGQSGIPDRPAQPTIGARQPSVLEYFRDGEFGGMDEIPVTIEEPWSNTLEDALRDWQAEAEGCAAGHNKAGYRLKYKYKLGGFVTITWGLVVLLVNGLLSCDDQWYAKFVTVFVNAINVTLIGLFSSMNLGQAYQEHFDYEARFAKLADDIVITLTRGRDYRIPADAFMSGVHERRKNLRSAPELPQGRYFFC